MRTVLTGDSPWPLFIHGPTGTGKTCAALCFGDWAGRSAYISLAKMCRLLIEAGKGILFGQEGRYAIGEGFLREQWGKSNLSVLDEIGTRDAVSDHHYETLKWAIDDRLERDLPLITISNLNPEEITRLYDDRISSRMCSGTIVECRGEDLRLAF